MGHPAHNDHDCSDCSNVSRTLIDCCPILDCCLTQVSGTEGEAVELIGTDARAVISGGGTVTLPCPDEVRGHSEFLLTAVDADVRVENVGVDGATAFTVLAGTTVRFHLVDTGDDVKAWFPESSSATGNGGSAALRRR